MGEENKPIRLEVLSCTFNQYASCKVITGNMSNGSSRETRYDLVLSEDAEVQINEGSPVRHIVAYVGQPDAIRPGDRVFSIGEDAIERLYFEVMLNRQRAELSFKEKHTARNPNPRDQSQLHR
jgi:hypothetical protein